MTLIAWGDRRDPKDLGDLGRVLAILVPDETDPFADIDASVRHTLDVLRAALAAR